ncbi:hypothetical protein BD779DRAFT_1499942 [Infundibulicybe gibba]|nr:hypothetical protein BD779DRAFT_1499942 [Infundibulicybe gibba]
MERLCDEVVQLVFYELPDPTPFTHVSRRFHRFSQDPYVRAHYFLARYGQTQAMFYALGRGKVLTEQVLDILLTSGAHLSRYLVQIAMHHYFHAQAHFIKTPWVRNVPLRVFAYFLKLAEAKYGEIPRGKGEDDGSRFSSFLKESRFPVQMKNVSWETIRDIMDSYNFIPFCNKDPIMAQFPLALAIEPRLLPYAVANGFHMDSKYRDFVFRKMFERPTLSETRPDDVAQNVRELCRLDSTMFVSRTVAAEVCMEAKLNDTGYSALKLLDKSGHLRFELSTLVEDLLKTFLKTRSISNPITNEVLRYLYTDFPSSDSSVRIVILVAVFISAENMQLAPATVHSRLETLGLLPITKKDLYNVLVNPFVERFSVLLEYAREEVGEGSEKGMNEGGVVQLIEESVAKCMEVACKGKIVKKFYDDYPTVHETIIRLVLEKYPIKMEDLPAWDEDPSAAARYETKLCRDFLKHGLGAIELENMAQLPPSEIDGERGMDEGLEHEPVIDALVIEDSHGLEEGRDEQRSSNLDLGIITQESLTTMIRHDEVVPARARRRMHYPYGVYGDSSGKLQYPHDPVHVGRWAKNTFGARSSVMAVLMTHAVINDNSTLLHNYLMFADIQGSSSGRVPITLKHFRLLARLGRAPSFYIYHDIEGGAEFFFDEEDYVCKTDSSRKLLKSKVKMEIPQGSIPSTSRFLGPIQSSSSPLLSSTLRGKKRPRRSAAAAVRSYAMPDSDEDTTAENYYPTVEKKGAETNLQKWLKHLGELMKEEQRKFKDKKKQLDMAAEPGTKLRIVKNEFLKSLISNLRTLRKVEEEKRLKLFGPEIFIDDDSDEDDDEYRHKTIRSKRRKIIRAS